MMYHRKARLPIDVKLLPTSDEPEESVNHFLDAMLDIKSGVKQNAMANITKAQKYQKQYYDQTKTVQEFNTGVKVLVENSYQKGRKGGKLCNRWLGPYTVHQNLGKGLYQLKNIDGSTLANKHNINRLKLYNSRGDNEDDATQKEHSLGHKLNKEGEMIPLEKIFSEEDNNVRGTTFTGCHAKNVNSPRKRKCEKSAAAQRSEKLRMKKRMITPKENIAPVIDLTSVELSQSDTSQTGGTVINTGLLFREVLRDNNTWLTDTVIHAAQVLMQKRYPTMRGLQDPILGQNLSFEVMREEFVQILHSGGNHWITISTISCPPATVMIYDSLYSKLPTHTKEQICALLNTKKPHINTVFVNVQSQNNACDCGVFAIAFAAALCEGKRPEELLFNNEALRKHLFKCFQEDCISQFPWKTVKRGCKVKNRKRIDIFCKMIQCADCQEWFHEECMRIPILAWTDPNYKWACEICKEM